MEGLHGLRSRRDTPGILTSTASPSTPVFGLDLDGVCADFLVWYRPIAARSLGVRPETLTLRPSGFGMAEWGMDKAKWSALAPERMSDGYRNIPVIEGARAGVESLRLAGWRIHVITRRAAIENDTGCAGAGAAAAADTIAWLTETGIPWDDITFVSDKTTVYADVYLDDDPNIIDTLRESGRRVVVFDTSYNSGVEGPRLFGWGDLDNTVRLFDRYLTSVIQAAA